MMFLKKLFPNTEPLEVNLEKADSIFEREKKNEIRNAEKEAEKFREEIKEDLKGLRKAVEGMEDFEDEKGRKAVDDISKNLVKDRKELIEQVNLTEDPEQNLEILKEFLRDFQSMKKKEAAVLEITEAHKDIASKLKSLEQTTDEIQGFVNGDYKIVSNFNQVKNKIQAKREQEMEIKGLKKEIKSKNTEKIKDKIVEKENEIKAFKNGQKMADYEEIKDQLVQKRSEKESETGNIEASCRKMHRALKKLIYKAENEDIELEKINILREIRDSEVDTILGRDSEEIKSAVKQLELFKDEVSETQSEKLLDGAEVIWDIDEIKSRINSLGKEIEDLEEKLDSHKAPQTLNEKESELQSLNEKLGNRQEELTSLEEELKDQKANKDELLSEIKQLFQKSFDRKVKFVSE